MSDPTPEVATAVQNNVGWLVAVVLGMWAWALRTAMGRHLRAFDDISATVKKIDSRLSYIEGRFKEQDSGR